MRKRAGEAVDHREEDDVELLLGVNSVEQVVHVRDAERMARSSRNEHRLGRAARALGVGAVGVEPEPQRHADRVRQRPREDDRAVDTAAHGDRHAARAGRCAKHRPDRVREGVDRECLAADGRGLEQRQPDERTVEVQKKYADVAKAEQEGEVIYYGHDGEAGIAALLDGFRKDFPKIKTSYVRLQTGALYAKITAERSASR